MAKNAYRKQPLSEEQQQALEETVEQKADVTRNWLKEIFSKEHVSAQTVAHYIGFVVFIGFLAILYIANRHYAERTIRQIDRLGREVKEMNWDYKSLSADLMKMTTQSEIAKKTDTMGLKERKEPPIKIMVSKEDKRNK
jgi:cell division protein FtsL